MGLTKADLRLNHPFIQNFIAGSLLFCLPGIYLALTGLGAGGGKPSSQVVAANVNAILYGIFFFTGWFAGTTLNILGPKWTFFMGSIGYSLYTGGLWYFDRSGNSWLAYLGGASEGVSAAMLWASAGYIAYSYAEEKDKAKFISIQWCLCEGGSTIAALVALGINTNTENQDRGAPTPVYIVFVVIQVFAMFMALTLLVKPSKIVRSDGTHIAIFKQPTLIDELKGVASLFTDYKFMMLLPAIFSAEMALALQSSLNGYYFNLRTRSLNNLSFNFIQIPASWLMTLILDKPGPWSLRRRSRALIGITLMSSITLAICSAEASWLSSHALDRNQEGPSLDWTDTGFSSPFVIYTIYGSIYSIYQIATQYVICSLSNDPSRLARYAGVFRGVTAFGMMCSFLLDGQGVSYVGQLAFQFSCYGIGIALLYVVAIKWIEDTNYFREENVIAPVHVEREFVEEGKVPGSAVGRVRTNEEGDGSVRDDGEGGMAERVSVEVGKKGHVES